MSELLEARQAAVGPTGQPEVRFYAHAWRLGDWADAIFESAVQGLFVVGLWLLVKYTVGMFGIVALAAPLSILVAVTVSVLFLKTVSDYFLKQAAYFFVSQRSFGYRDRIGRHEWGREELKQVVKVHKLTGGDQSLSGKPGGYRVLRFLGERRGRSVGALWRLVSAYGDRNALDALCSLNLYYWDNDEWRGLIGALGVPLVTL